MSRSAFTALAAAAFLGGCVSPPPPKTAVEYENAAAGHEAKRQFDEAPVRVQETTRPVPSLSQIDTNPEPQVPFGNGNGMWIAGYAAGDAVHQQKAARKALEEASRIRDYAAVQCTRVPVEDQRVCPLPQNAVRVPIPQGVRYVALGTSVENLGPEVRCAVARAEVETPRDAERCPLLVPNADVRVVPDKQGAAVEIRGHDLLQTDEIRRRAGLPIP